MADIPKTSPAEAPSLEAQLTTAQLALEEWRKLANDHRGQIEELRTALEDAAAARRVMESDLVMARSSVAADAAEEREQRIAAEAALESERKARVICVESEEEEHANRVAAEAARDQAVRERDEARRWWNATASGVTYEHERADAAEARERAAMEALESERGKSDDLGRLVQARDEEIAALKAGLPLEVERSRYALSERARVAAVERVERLEADFATLRESHAIEFDRAEKHRRTAIAADRLANTAQMLIDGRLDDPHDALYAALSQFRADRAAALAPAPSEETRPDMVCPRCGEEGIEIGVEHKCKEATKAGEQGSGAGEVREVLADLKRRVKALEGTVAALVEHAVERFADPLEQAIARRLLTLGAKEGDTVRIKDLEDRDGK